MFRHVLHYKSRSPFILIVLLHHPVDLLEGESLGLRDEEVGVHKGGSAETTPDEEDRGAEVAPVLTDHVRGDDGDDGVPEPVRGGREGDTTGSDGEREDLTDDDPRARTPGGGEEEDEDGNEGDLSVNGADVLGNCLAGSVGGELVEADGDTDDSDDELADGHGAGTDDEEGTT